MTPSTSTRKVRRVDLRTILFVAVFGLAWGTVPGVYHRWETRRKYDQRYSKMLELPSSISQPRAYLQRMPGVVGKALWIDFYQPNADEDVKLRDWFVKHDGFSEFKLRDRHLPKPIGSWEAEKGVQFLIFSRQSDDGWVHISLGQGMTPNEAKKDLATFPWKAAEDERQRRRNE